MPFGTRTKGDYGNLSKQSAASLGTANLFPQSGVAPNQSSPTGNARSDEVSIPGNPQKDPATQLPQQTYNPLDHGRYEGDAGAAGSGFINLNHLLDLNGQSGRDSAKALAKSFTDKGAQASQGITDIDAQNAKDVAAGIPNPQFDVGSGDAQSEIDAAKKSAYGGPEDLTSNGAYADMAKKTGESDEASKNLRGGGYGIAAEVNKASNLSPVQSAAGAFYMGVNNQALRTAAGQFTNLSKALQDANSRAMDRAGLARQSVSAIHDNADQWQHDLDAWNTSGKQTAEDARRNAALAANDKSKDERDATIQQNDARNHATPEIRAQDDIDFDIVHGMPGELAYAGIDYNEWLDDGKPTAEQYWKKHPDRKKPGDS